MHWRSCISLVILLAMMNGGCSTQPVAGGFQSVCDQLVELGPASRAMNMGANSEYYASTYGIYYDAATDALYTKTGSGNRDYILEGDVIRATFLIDRRKDRK